MSILPFNIPSNHKVLIVGAGGGFDFLCGLPIALELEAQGVQTFFGNLSFTHLSEVRGGTWQSDTLLKIDADAYLPSGGYFPEVFLAQWYRQYRQRDMNVWCLQPAGVAPTRRSYDQIIAENGIDTVICIDGGVDGIFRGDEYDLGTPSMDAASVIAASLCSAREKIYVCTAFGIEGAETGLSHAQVLNRMADLVQQNAMLGVGMVLRNTPAGEDFVRAVSFVHSHMAYHQNSTIVSAILAAMDGNFGRTAVNAKTQERQPWISPLTALYWYFQADAVARLKLFYPQVIESQTVEEIAKSIEKIRQERGVSPNQPIPL